MKNRDMFYQNIQASANNPGMFIPPNGYNYQSQYQAYGPNLQQPNPNTINNDDYMDRISRLERQVKVLDNRLQKLESASINETTDNFYMI